MENIKYDSNGLVPAVVQDATTKEVLMVAYMNEESLELSLKTGRATFWSRSRNELWEKGKTSGNFMYIKEIRVDCDCDCLLVLAEPAGAACHTGKRTCFYRDIDGAEIDLDKKDSSDILSRLMAVTEDRKKNPQEGSYTNYLFDKGEDKILKKVGEEVCIGEGLVGDWFSTEGGGQVRVEIIARVCMSCVYACEVEAQSEDEAFAKAYLALELGEADELQTRSVEGCGDRYLVTLEYTAVEIMNF